MTEKIDFFVITNIQHFNNMLNIIVEEASKHDNTHVVWEDLDKDKYSTRNTLKVYVKHKVFQDVVQPAAHNGSVFETLNSCTPESEKVYENCIVLGNSYNLKDKLYSLHDDPFGSQEKYQEALESYREYISTTITEFIDNIEQ